MANGARSGVPPITGHGAEGSGGGQGNQLRLAVTTRSLGDEKAEVFDLRVVFNRLKTVLEGTLVEGVMQVDDGGVDGAEAIARLALVTSLVRQGEALLWDLMDLADLNGDVDAEVHIAELRSLLVNLRGAGFGDLTK